MPNRMMQWFQFNHLPAVLQGPSKACAQLAEAMDALLPEGPEKTAGLRKLLEAKDCFVRAAIEGVGPKPERHSAIEAEAGKPRSGEGI